ncbi:hypothetical protein C8R47DRAFT_1227987 [Mycena vitilis]|nr:hypothetical protein C8R47DRAFT_1227987 [Mycena vitilis]
MLRPRTKRASTQGFDSASTSTVPASWGPYLSAVDVSGGFYSVVIDASEECALLGAGHGDPVRSVIARAPVPPLYRSQGSSGGRLPAGTQMGLACLQVRHAKGMCLLPPLLVPSCPPTSVHHRHATAQLIDTNPSHRSRAPDTPGALVPPTPHLRIAPPLRCTLPPSTLRSGKDGVASEGRGRFAAAAPQTLTDSSGYRRRVDV